jgi:uncharacterized Tic20 family protein
MTNSALNSDPTTPTPSQTLAPESELMWASLAHLGGVTGVVPALVIWLAIGRRSSFVENQAREAVNFQLTGLIGWVVVFTFTAVSVSVWNDFAVFVAPVMYFSLWATLATFSIIGFLAVKRGDTYRYRVALRPFG